MSSNNADFNYYLNTQGPRGPKGNKGDRGFSPSISIAQDTLNTFKLRITNEDGSFDTSNLRGSIISGGEVDGFISYNHATDTLFVSPLPQAFPAGSGIVKFATEAEVLGNAENVAMSPSDLQDYLANKLVGTGTISVTKDEATGTVTFNVPEATDPITIVDGKVALKVDGQLVTVNPQGELTVNLDEVGEEMMELQSQINTLNETIAALTSRIASLEAEIDGGEVQ